MPAMVQALSQVLGYTGWGTGQILGVWGLVWWLSEQAPMLDYRRMNPGSTHYWLCDLEQVILVHTCPVSCYEDRMG